MEFIKIGKNYMIKNGNGRIITEKEKLELENKELIIKDIQSNECQGKTTQKLARNKKKIAELKKNNIKINVELEPIDSKRVIKHIKEEKFVPVETMDELDTAPVKENADDTIKETDSTL